MHKKHLHEMPDTSRGFEQSDLDIGQIKVGVIIFFGFAVAVAVVVFVWFAIRGDAQPQESNVALTRRIPADPNPLLQNGITARTDIWNLRARETFLLHTPTWVDEKKGIARIPIDDAINMAANLGPGGAAVQPAQPATPSSSNPISSPITPTTRSTVNQGLPPNSAAGARPGKPDITNPPRTRPNDIVLPRGATTGR